MNDDTQVMVHGCGQQGGAAMEMSPQDVVAQVTKIQQVMKSCMKEGEHFGKIPGCGDKPTLLKAGAEKLNLTFRLAAEFTINQTDYPEAHREYQVTCRLTHIPTGNFVGSGVGAASTMETKWRYRWENTGKQVPKEYWENRDVTLLGGPDFVARKVRGNGGSQVWMIYHRIPHDNPADYYNTVLKMSKKRAHVDAVLTSTAASDIFTQDIEELKENGVIDVPDTQERAPISEPTSTRQSSASATPPPENMPTGAIVLGNYSEKTGQGKRGPWTKYSCKGNDGKWYATFDAKTGAKMKDMQGKPVHVKVEKADQYGITISDIKLAVTEAKEPQQEPTEQTKHPRRTREPGEDDDLEMFMENK